MRPYRASRQIAGETSGLRQHRIPAPCLGRACGSCDSTRSVGPPAAILPRNGIQVRGAEEAPPTEHSPPDSVVKVRCRLVSAPDPEIEVPLFCVQNPLSPYVEMQRVNDALLKRKLAGGSLSRVAHPHPYPDISRGRNA
jgi:hypothetical protein